MSETTKTRWTPEPWPNAIYWQDADCSEDSVHLTPADFERARRCVNDCAGFNPVGFRACMEALRDLVRIVESFEGIEFSRDYERPDQAKDHFHMAMDTARKVLALATTPTTENRA